MPRKRWQGEGEAHEVQDVAQIVIETQMPHRKSDHPVHLLLGEATWTADLHGVGTVTPERGEDGPSAEERLDQDRFFRVSVGGARHQIAQSGVGVVLLQAAEAERYVRPRATG